MKSYTLLNAVTATGVGTTVALSAGQIDRDEMLVQVDITGTSGTVVIYGRVSKAMPYGVLATITASGFYPLTKVSQVYADVTAISAATIKAAILI